MKFRPVARAIVVVSVFILLVICLGCGGGGGSSQQSNPVTLQQISIAPANQSILKGATLQLAATGNYSDGSSKTLDSVTWQVSSSTSSYAEITAQGLVTGMAEGVAQVSAAYQGVTGSTSVTVGAPALNSITVTPSQSFVPAGMTEQLMATGNFSDGSTQDLTQTATWSSSAMNIATINSAGLASGLIIGSTAITATYGSVQGTTTVSVTLPLLTAVAVTPAGASVAAGYTQQFTATGSYTDGSTQNLTSTATWTSSASSVATINATGLATSLAKGISTVTASMGSISGSNTLSVTAAVLVSIAVNPGVTALPVGETQTLTATGTFSDGSTQDLTGTAAWSSSAPTVAAISGGAASALSVGNSTITAMSGTVQGSATINVVPAALLSITLGPQGASVAAGNTQQFTALGAYSDGSTQNLTGTAIWSSSAPTVATVSGSGLATSLITGAASISATVGSINGSAMLTVTAPALVSIGVTPANGAMPLSSAQTFSATGIYTDGSTQDLTSTAMWTSSAPAVAPVSNTPGSQGMVTAATLGSATITATSGSINGSTGLTVTAGFVLTGSLNTARASHTSTMLNNGLVLIAGGYNGATLASAELYNPATGTFTPTGSLNTARLYHTATLLNNGMVLIAGGSDNSGNILSSAELYDPVAGVFTPTGNLNVPRALHTATASNGTVLIAGGQGSDGPLGSAELYDATTGTFTLTGSLNTARFYHTATLLNNGSVLITGGYDSNGNISSGAELYNPATATFVAALNLNTARYKHTATLLNGGMVLIAGGEDVNGNSLTNAELFNPTTGAFTASGGLNTARYLQTATLLNNGTELAAGGYGASVYLNSAELNNPAPSTFAATGSLNTSRYQHSATMLANGHALVAGGYNSGGYLASAELYETSSLTPANLVSIALSPANPTVPLDTAQQMIATGTFSDGSTQQLASVTWSSANTAAVSVTDDASNSGAAYALGSGSATVSACAGTVCGSTSVTVGTSALEFITVTPANGTVAAGVPQQFSATGTYSDGSTQDLTSSVTWSSSAPTVAAINASGLANTFFAGNTTIAAASGTIQGTASLIVTAPVLTSMAVAPVTTSIAIGETQQFTATGTYSDGSMQDLTNVATWASTDPTIASVSAGGTALAVAVGTVTISANSGSFSGSATLTVSPAALTSLSIVPSNVSIILGATSQLQAVGTFSDGSTQNMTTMVTWSSAQPVIASVNSTGLVKANEIGSTTITAQNNGISGSANVTVTPLLLVDYFNLANAQASGVDGSVQLTNPGIKQGNLCSMIYVFDRSQEMIECCGCSISADGIRTLSLVNDLTANPLTGIQPVAGVVEIISSDPAQSGQCNAGMVVPDGQLSAWGTHIQDTTGTMTEAEFAVDPLSSAQGAALANECAAIQQLGSGQGICSCGTGD